MTMYCNYKVTEADASNCLCQHQDLSSKHNANLGLQFICQKSILYEPYPQIVAPILFYKKMYAELVHTTTLVPKWGQGGIIEEGAADLINLGALLGKDEIDERTL